MQRHVRGLLTRIHYHLGDWMWAAKLVQRAARGFVARKRFREAEEERERLRSLLMQRVSERVDRQVVWGAGVSLPDHESGAFPPATPPHPRTHPRPMHFNRHMMKLPPFARHVSGAGSPADGWLP